MLQCEAAAKDKVDILDEKVVVFEIADEEDVKGYAQDEAL